MIGVKALYFLFAWLISAAAASWLSERKGYGERVGLTFGLFLSVAGVADRPATARAPRLEVAGRRLATAVAATILSRAAGPGSSTHRRLVASVRPATSGGV